MAEQLRHLHRPGPLWACLLLLLAAAGCSSADDCPAGTAGCACLADSTCTPDDSGMPNVCDIGIQQCVHRMPERPAPADPRCYTPCSNDLVLANGEIRTCDHEGLMEGCIGAAECVNGSCLAPATAVPAAGALAGAFADPGTDAFASTSAALPQPSARDASCTSDHDCPDFQACLEGACYSECEVNSECPAPMVCRRRVCRIECSTADPASCPQDYVCTSADGAMGVCTPAPRSDPSMDPPAPGRERFSLSETGLSFTSNTTSGSFTITNQADTPMVYSVRKVDHVEIRDDGRVRETEVPLFWISMGEEGALTRERELEVAVGPGESKTILLRDVGNETLDQWEGHIEVFQPGAGAQTVALHYSTSPDGLWVGKIHYLVEFAEGGDEAIEAWRQDPGARDLAERTRNALLVRWADFVSDPLFTLRQWQALVDATLTGSWAYPLVREACLDAHGADSRVQCYPYVSGPDADSGLRVYTDSDSLRIPTGVMEMPFAMTLRRQPGADASAFEGRVDSGRALQYPGGPGVSLRFGADPASCERDGEACLVPVEHFEVIAHTGARYLAGDAACAGGWYALDEPWLVATFTQGTMQREDEVGLLRRECRDAGFPLVPASDRARHENASLAGANPIPDGQRRQRRLELLDGRLINQDTLFLLVRERFEARLAGTAPQEFAGYGIMVLRKQPADLTAEDYEPAEEPAAAPPAPADSGALGDFYCPVVDELVTQDNAGQVAALLLDGRDQHTELIEVPYDDGDGVWQAHYLCHDTGRFDGGRPGHEPESCPHDSQVTYFLSTEDVASDNCQGTSTCIEGLCEDDAQRGTCEARLREMLTLRPQSFELSPLHECEDPEQVHCSEDRQDLLAGKIFYLRPEGDTRPRFLAIEQAIAPAFLYRTRFRARSGQQLGFVPTTCELGEATPYCYDPAAIEELRGRVDCLIRIQRSFALERRPPGDIAPRIGDRVDDYLFDSFGGRSDQGVDGFERMYAELLVMLGDDAFTRALGSRFDLAGAAVGTFEGQRFEPDGITLPGGAGYEMRALYQAKQAYELVVDRFYRQSGILWDDVAHPDGPSLVNAATIANYLGRVVLASTKKAKVTSEIARRYQGFGRPDLARHAIEREYARAYLESVVLYELLAEFANASLAQDRTFLTREMERAQNLYRAALDAMRETYRELSDDLTYFGDPADFIPFPAPHRFDVVSPQIMIERANDTMRVAKERDDRALASNRQFDTDAAQFQSELRRVELQYENQLTELCGSFEGVDDAVYPAIPKYTRGTYLALLGGNPCGLVGPRPGEAPGQIFQARREVEIAAAELRLAVQETRDILAQKAIEERRVEQECQGRVDIATLRYEGAGEVIELEKLQHQAEFQMSQWERRLAAVDRTARVANAVAMTAQNVAMTAEDCAEISLNPFKLIGSKAACAAGGVATVAFGVAAAAETAGLVLQGVANADNARLQKEINEAAHLIGEVQATTEARAAMSECRICTDWLDGTRQGGGVEEPDDCPSGEYRDGPLLVESRARIDTLLVGMVRASLNGMRAELAFNLAQGRLAALQHQAHRQMAQAAEAEQLLLDVEAARNDPNIRLLRNADVLDADKAFHDALVDAYRATRVFEYYTAQSYGPKQELFLARLAGRGEHSIENYLLDLQRALNDFENVNGRPDKRLHVVSLRDDVLRVPRTDPLGTPYTDAERIEMFRRALLDPDHLDAHGYPSFPFAIGLDVTSPATAVHKIAHIEAEIQGSGVGDRLGRVSLTPRGTASVRGLDGAVSFLRLPAIRAEIDTFFNGVKPSFIDPELYQSVRLRERPLANSLWELGLNLRDDEVNRDIRPEELTDIRLYVYYEDFTQLDY